MQNATFSLEAADSLFIGRFTAMASECEVLVDTHKRSLAGELVEIAMGEAMRIEHKFSRYSNSNLVHEINTADGAAVHVDKETALLLDFAHSAYELSDGLFDLTSGVAREIWRFDGSDNVPSTEQAQQLAQRIGWHRATWLNPELTLQPGMQVDFGGCAKEYAVDRACALMQQKSAIPVLVNFGGDIAVNGVPQQNGYWHVGLQHSGIEHSHPQLQPGRQSSFKLHGGALASSGDANRYLLKDGVRYPHVINPATVWPVMDAPRTVTVAAPSCLEAGFLATVALLHGAEAAAFLDAQHVPYVIQP